MRDPVRLKAARSGSSAALRELLRAGRAEAAPEEALRGVAAGLLVTLGHAGMTKAAGAATGAPLLATAAVATSTKVGVAVLAMALAAGAGAFVHHARAVRAVTVVLAATPSPSAPAPLASAPAESLAPAPQRPAVRRSGAESPGQSMAEVELLDRAMAASQADPGRALALAKEHARRFPAGALVQEREVIAIEALARLHRTAEASGRAADFLRRFPSSAHRVRVEAFVERAGGDAKP